MASYIKYSVNPHLIFITNLMNEKGKWKFQEAKTKKNTHTQPVNTEKQILKDSDANETCTFDPTCLLFINILDLILRYKKI